MNRQVFFTEIENRISSYMEKNEKWNKALAAVIILGATLVAPAVAPSKAAAGLSAFEQSRLAEYWSLVESNTHYFIGYNLFYATHDPRGTLGDHANDI